MTRATCFDAAADGKVPLGFVEEQDLGDFIAWIMQRRSERGCPAVEFERLDGSSLLLGTDGTRATLVWSNSLGESRCCVGDQPGKSLTFDAFGSRTEVPQELTIPLELALDCARRFLSTGVSESEQVSFQVH